MCPPRASGDHHDEYRIQARIVVNPSCAAARGTCGQRLGRAGSAAGGAGLHATAHPQADGRRVRLCAHLAGRPQADLRVAASGAPGRSRIWTETLVDLTTKTVLFNESGIERMLVARRHEDHLLGRHGRDRAERRHRRQNHQSRRRGLGDYYSWATRDGKESHLTIESNYYYLDQDKAVCLKGVVVPRDWHGRRPAHFQRTAAGSRPSSRATSSCAASTTATMSSTRASEHAKADFRGTAVTSRFMR